MTCPKGFLLLFYNLKVYMYYNQSNLLMFVTFSKIQVFMIFLTLSQMNNYMYSSFRSYFVTLIQTLRLGKLILWNLSFVCLIESDCIKVQKTSGAISIIFPRPFEEKRADIVFGIAWFYPPSNNRYLVCATPPTVLCRSF